MSASVSCIESSISLPACSLSPAPVQKYPIFFGLMLLPVKGVDGKGGVGTCKIGRGGAFETMGSVIPGIVGISGGRDS
jgi:hypothetical protein